jgi:quercetin dioxygenase-like cupin family protein
MFIDGEGRKVYSGDAVFIPGGSTHGIKNNALETLTYLTANKAFGVSREKEIWGNGE